MRIVSLADKLLGRNGKNGTVAYVERHSRYELANVALSAKKAGSGYAVNGAKSVVLHGGTADKLIVSARVSGERRSRENEKVPPRGEGFQARRDVIQQIVSIACERLHAIEFFGHVAQFHRGGTVQFVRACVRKMSERNL